MCIRDRYQRRVHGDTINKEVQKSMEPDPNEFWMKTVADMSIKPLHLVEIKHQHLKYDPGTKSEVYSINWNIPKNRIGVGTTLGYLIYDLGNNRMELLKNIEKEKNYLDTGIYLLGLWFKQNTYAMVGDGKNPAYPRQKIFIWDEDHRTILRTSNNFPDKIQFIPVSYTHLRAHETPEHLVCRLLLEKKKAG
eukprot:TRINITY_DN9406_c0_g1_i6.p1 TRINITY_DN9406_c0_g1~~TRINITY_DN9406_c0_g1_i6.p1  ORF type:complete len:192 (-),score=33.85 TRINITY_DN9406_c0_g1_i6:20-595(-)